MKRTFGKLGCLALAGITAILVSVKIAQAQRNSLTVKDANGKEVIVYQESHALVIWAGDYKNWGKLNNVQNEAKEVITALQKQGFKVTVIDNPNGNQLSNGIKNFIDNYGYVPNNRLVIFFSGHGYTRQQTKGYLVPVDAPDPIVDERGFLKAALSMEQINSWASQMEAKHVLFVFDSCFSGTIFKQRSNGDDARDAYIRDVMNKPVRQFLTAGDANEKVPAKSVFTPLFLRALEGDADYTKDGYVTGRELGLYLTQNLTNYTKGNQHPQFGTILDPNLDRGDIVFRSDLAVASSPPPVKPTPTESPSTNPVSQPPFGSNPTIAKSRTGVAIVSDPPSNVRKSPNGAILCSVRKKSTINVYGSTSSWYYTDVCGSMGVIESSQIKLNPTESPSTNPVSQPPFGSNPTIAKSRTGVAIVFDPPSNVRKSPNGVILCSVRKKSTINIYGSTSSWYYTDVCGSMGVIESSQIKLNPN